VKKFSEYLQLAIKLGEAALLIALVILCVRLSSALKGISASGQAISELARNTDKQLNGTLAQHGTDGAIFSLKKAVDDVRAGAVKVSRQETQYYSTLKANTDEVVSRVNGNMDELRSTLVSVNKSQEQIANDAHETFLNANAAISRLPHLVDQSTSTLHSAQVLFDDPSIPMMFRHLESTSSHFDVMANDAQLGFHKWLNPSKKAIVWGYVWKGSLVWGSRFVP